MISTPAKWIDEVIRVGPASLLKRLGYKKMGRRFVKANTASTSHIDFQASQWNNDTQARFTLNISCHFPGLEVVSSDISPNKMFTRSMATVGVRIGHLMPGHQDFWWLLTADSDRMHIGAEVTASLETYALPYLETVQTMEGIAEHGGHNPLIGKFPNLAVASALAVLGRHDEAIAVFNEYTSNRSTLSNYEQAWLEKYGNKASLNEATRA
jgi:hypothetical protein